MQCSSIWRYFVLAVFVAPHTASAQPQIRLTHFQIEPLELAVGQAFTVSACAETSGVSLGSFLLRTADDVRKQDTIPGFPLYTNGRYYLAEKGRYFLRDNGQLDRDPAERAFSISLTTEGWREGTYRFAFFASCRPSSGPFVAARHDFSVTVKDGRVKIEVLGATSLAAEPAISEFCVEPELVLPGQTVQISLKLDTSRVAGLQLVDPFYIPADEALPGFRYDAKTKKSFYPTEAADAADNGLLDADPAVGKVSLELNTNAWPSGGHHLQLDAISPSGRSVDYRNFAVTVRDPRDQLEITVQDSWPLGEGTHFGRFVRLRDGTLFCGDRYSDDNGRTWQGTTGGFGVGAEQLGDGRVLGFDYRCLPIEDESGWYTLERSLAAVGEREFQKSTARVFVSDATAAMGHGPHVGPLFMRSLVERNDGSLVGLFAGWFTSDTALCPYGRGRPYSRTYVCESSDEGITWKYLTTIGYDQIGSEGYNEGSMRRLANGRLLAVIRTGNERDFACQDNPIMWSESRDEGRTWSPPQRTGLEGAYPSLAVLSDGHLVISYGRPGAMLAFSADDGRTWTDHTVVDATPYSGYTDVVEIAPGHLLVGFGARVYLNPATGTRANQLRLANVRVR